ncbi:hypothetical protein C1645_830810 [Glomus cerebriforme]|uniref:Uncharacterized protein n=1 Tax=Glomus cerebriforme TaxID=658196 RepID=A0A397SMW2_9GLOM|nr:hypothetical protein C1645_830810 [Glomus cerebriforme]
MRRASLLNANYLQELDLYVLSVVPYSASSNDELKYVSSKYSKDKLKVMVDKSLDNLEEGFEDSKPERILVEPDKIPNYIVDSENSDDEEDDNNIDDNDDNNKDNIPEEEPVCQTLNLECKLLSDSLGDLNVTGLLRLPDFLSELDLEYKLPDSLGELDLEYYRTFWVTELLERNGLGI